MSVERRMFSCQDTGNPVLDSVVNLACALGIREIAVLSAFQEELMKIAEKEPGGLARRGRDGHLEFTKNLTVGGPPAPHARKTVSVDPDRPRDGDIPPR